MGTICVPPAENVWEDDEAQNRRIENIIRDDRIEQEKLDKRIEKGQQKLENMKMRDEDIKSNFINHSDTMNFVDNVIRDSQKNSTQRWKIIHGIRRWKRKTSSATSRTLWN
jgi:hypothetical protein